MTENERIVFAGLLAGRRCGRQSGNDANPPTAISIAGEPIGSNERTGAVPNDRLHAGLALAIVPCRLVTPASANHRKPILGSVAYRIAKKILSSRGPKVVDLASWREGRKMALDAGLGGEGPVPVKFADLDTCYAIYALVENLASLVAESISVMREAKGFVRIAGDAEDECMPSGPPTSPLTVSYFTMWALFATSGPGAAVSLRRCGRNIRQHFSDSSILSATH